MRFLVPPRRRWSLGLTPLIDVVFILLLFFLLAARMPAWNALPLALPPRAVTAEHPPPPLVIGLSSDGRITLNEVPVAADRLEEQLRPYLATAQRVVVRPAAEVSLQQLVSLLERLAAAGVSAPSWE